MTPLDGRGYPRLYLKLEVEFWRPSIRPRWGRITDKGWAQTWVRIGLPVSIRFEYRTRNAQQAHADHMASIRDLRQHFTATDLRFRADQLKGSIERGELNATEANDRMEALVRKALRDFGFKAAA